MYEAKVRSKKFSGCHLLLFLFFFFICFVVWMVLFYAVTPLTQISERVDAFKHVKPSIILYMLVSSQSFITSTPEV